MSDFPETFHRSLYHKSDDPEHADNRDSREFLDGYAEGLTAERGIESIGNEWRARGCPEELSDGFREWKRGFNAATMRKAWTNGGPR